MKLKRFSSCLVLFAFLSDFVSGDVDFIDCGSEKLFVDLIDIPGCKHAPCRIRRGYNYQVYIIPDHLDPQVDSVTLRAYVQLWGAFFPLIANCSNPCGTSCPLRQRLNSPRLDFTIGFPESLQRHPAILYIIATHKNQGATKSNICVSINITLQ